MFFILTIYDLQNLFIAFNGVDPIVVLGKVVGGFLPLYHSIPGGRRFPKKVRTRSPKGNTRLASAVLPLAFFSRKKLYRCSQRQRPPSR